MSITELNHIFSDNGESLTTEEISILRFIYNYILKNGYSPGFSDISTAMNWRSKQTCFKKLHKLKEEGFVFYTEKIARSINLAHFNIELNPNDEKGVELQKILKN